MERLPTAENGVPDVILLFEAEAPPRRVAGPHHEAQALLGHLSTSRFGWLTEHPTRVLEALQRVKREDGSWAWFECRASVEVNGIVVAARDVTRRRLNEVAQRMHTARLQAVLDLIDTSVGISTRDGGVVLANAACSRLLAQWEDEGLAAAIVRLIAPGVATSSEIELADGIFLLSVKPLVADEAEDLWWWSIADVSEQVRSLRESSRLATRDELTGALNRRGLNLELGSAVKKTAPFAVCMIDLDGFKAINDEQGHTAGDEVLTLVAQTLRGQLRSTDVVCRAGGDEFVIIGPGVATAEAGAQLARKVIKAVEDCGISASVGVALFPSERATPKELLATADERMFENKRTRRANR